MKLYRITKFRWNNVTGNSQKIDVDFTIVYTTIVDTPVDLDQTPGKFWIVYEDPTQSTAEV